MGASPSGNSYLDSFKRCRRKFYYSHIMKLEPKGRALALDIGTLVHEGLAVLQSGGIAKADEKMLSVWAKDMEEYWAPNEYGDSHTAIDMAMNLVQAYDIEYTTDPFTALVDEFEFAFKLPSGHTYTGKTDRLVKDPGGRIFVMEHKTTGLAPSMYLRTFFLNPQITGYYIGAAEALPPDMAISGVIVDLLVKPRKGKKGFSALTEKNFVRDIFVRTEEHVESFLANTSRIFTEIDKCEGKKERFYQCEHECFSFNKPCPFLDLCTYGDDEGLIQQNYTRKEEE